MLTTLPTGHCISHIWGLDCACAICIAFSGFWQKSQGTQVPHLWLVYSGADLLGWSPDFWFPPWWTQLLTNSSPPWLDGLGTGFYADTLALALVSLFV